MMVLSCEYRVALVLAVAIVLSGGCARTVAIEERSLDGHWWMSLSSQNRDDVLAAIRNCDLTGPRRLEVFATRAWSSIRDDITEQYSRPGNSLGSVSILSVLSNLGTSDGAPRATGGQLSSPSDYDALHWSQLYSSGGRESQRSFVAGYFICEDWKTGANVQVTLDEMVDEVSKWYGFDGKAQQWREDREATPIGNVIRTIRLGHNRS